MGIWTSIYSTSSFFFVKKLIFRGVIAPFSHTGSNLYTPRAAESENVFGCCFLGKFCPYLLVAVHLKNKMFPSMKNCLDLNALYVEMLQFRTPQVCQSAFEPVWVTQLIARRARAGDCMLHVSFSPQLTARGLWGSWERLLWSKNRRNSLLTRAGTFMTAISFHTVV